MEFASYTDFYNEICRLLAQGAPMLKGGVNGRLAGKAAVVTGGAQGFGEGIAREMAAQGARLVIADHNMEKAEAAAQDIRNRFGEDAAYAIRTNVADEQSVMNLVLETINLFGRLDIFISNAGIQRSGSLADMALADFEAVTMVNYVGYFICAKVASAAMKAQRAITPVRTFDIIHINAKPGMEGADKSIASVGGRFGCIGLTQSFAKELAEYGVKVNAICPGSRFDGLLWMDPDRSLFTQYLADGEAPGAENTADAKRFFEAKASMNRGCTPKDVAIAIFYCVEQQYETGQAIPVTGGQRF